MISLSFLSTAFKIQSGQIMPILKEFGTGKSLSEALIFASINPQYDNRLFMELPVQYMNTTSAEHEQNMFLPCSAHVLGLQFSCTEVVIP